MLKQCEPYIIAEAGVNHNGELSLAFGLIDAAKRAGADCVKFQLFDVASMCVANATLANYQSKNINEDITQYEMLKRYQFDISTFAVLKKYCEETKIDFLLSVFDLPSLRDWRSLDAKAIKIPSGEITNYGLLTEIGISNVDKYLSTGASDLDEIDEALVLLGAGNQNSDICILHCTTSYPCGLDDANLSAIGTLRHRYPFRIGYSDHTKDISAGIIAVALGASVLEKHLTLDNALPGPDHVASLNPTAFREYVLKAKEAYKLLGESSKKPTSSELCIRPMIRKGVYTKAEIMRGEVFTAENILVARPENGISPRDVEALIGRPSSKNYLKYQCIDPIEISDAEGA